MKPLLSSTALAALMLAGGAEPAAAARFFVQSCPFTAMTPGTYILARDLICPGDGVVITADDVRLVLGGHTLTGSGSGAGVHADTADDPITGLRVTSGTVTGFTTGVLLVRTPGARLAAVTAADNEGIGIMASE